MWCHKSQRRICKNDTKLEQVDLTTQPNTKECKTVTFKTPDVIAFRQEHNKIFDEKLEAMECKNKCHKFYG